MRAIVDIPAGDPYAGLRIFNLEIAPIVGHYVGDPNGNLYKITAIIHLVDPSTEDSYPGLKLFVSRKQSAPDRD